MSTTFNGNGNGAASLIRKLKKKTVRPQPVATSSEAAETQVSFQTAEGVTLCGMPLRTTRHAAVFELYNPRVALRLSETLDNFQIVFQTRKVYSGRAVIRNIMDAGTKIVCETTLDESRWTDWEIDLLMNQNGQIAEKFKTFTIEWQKIYKISSEFKMVVADMQTFLYDLRLWLEQIEAGIRTSIPASRLELEHNMAQRLRPIVAPAIHAHFERFEIALSRVDVDLMPVYRMFCHRQLHPLLLCSPFMHRIYTKPLGYAGDYEMIDMIIRNDYEGESLFAKLLHAYIIDQAPARSVRNRTAYFTQKFIEEASRISAFGRAAHIYSLGCGPAREVQNFLAEHPLSARTQFSLLDFNEETLIYTANKMDEARIKYRRKTPINMIKNSVNYLLKEAYTSTLQKQRYDFIYCSGLYDYLNDQVCKQLNTYLYDQLLPGGILIVTNFDPSNPIQNIMEYLFEWFLIHRNSKQLAALAPEQVLVDDCVVKADSTGCNVFLEVRKPL